MTVTISATKTKPARIPIANPIFTEAEARAVYDVVKSGWVTMGPKVAAFEEAFASYVGAKHAIAMANGTVTLHAVLAALGIGPGDEVIVPTLTYIATAATVLQQGATLVLCECDPATYNVTVADIEKVMTPRTKAIVAVDMNGLPVDYKTLVPFAKKHNVTFIADSAEALGAKYEGKLVGAQAPVHSFSFFGNKNITTGEGGMVTTNDDALAAELRILRNQGQQGRYNHTHLGYNYRMTDMQAALGIAQLERIEERIAMKEAIVARYIDQLSGDSLISMPVVPKEVTRHSWYMFAPAFDPSVDRDGVVRSLEEENIETRLSFPPVHIQPYYATRFGYTRDAFAVSYDAWSHLINLPIWPELPHADVDRVAEATKRAVAANAR